MLPCFAYGCAHTCCWAWGFLCFLTILCPPSGSGSTGSSGYSSPLGFSTFAMGPPLRGRGLFVLDRNEGLVSPFGSGPLVSSWLDLTSLRALSLRVCCQMVLAVSVSSVVLSSLQCSSLSHVGVQGCLRDPCCGSGVVLGTLPFFCRLGFCTSVGGSACSRWRPLTGWFSLKLRVVGGSWFSPLCSPGRRSASRSTYSALPPVSRLFFGLAAFSFG